MQQSILEYQMKIKKPDIYIKPELKDIGLLEFDKAEYILKSVKGDTSQFREKLKQEFKK